jgi:hypothetical protein
VTALLSAALAASIPLGAQAAAIFDNWNGVSALNGPPVGTTFTLTQPALIPQISDYHWNSGRGAAPGTIGIQHNPGALVGTYKAVGSAGSGGVQNANWTAAPNVCLPAGQYVVIDSSQATWSFNSASKNEGFANVQGTYGCTPSKTVGVTGGGAPVVPKPTAPPTPKPAPPAFVACLVNSGSWAEIGPKPCQGPIGTVIDVKLVVAKAPYTPYNHLVYRPCGPGVNPTGGQNCLPQPPVVTAAVTSALAGSSTAGAVMTSSAPPGLCVYGSNYTWQVFLVNASGPISGEIGLFAITGCP